MTQIGLKLMDALYGKTGARTKRRCGLRGNDSRTRERLGRRKFDAQPVFVAAAFGPDRGHLRTGVSGYHRVSTERGKLVYGM